MNEKLTLRVSNGLFWIYWLESEVKSSDDPFDGHYVQSSCKDRWEWDKSSLCSHLCFVKSETEESLHFVSYIFIIIRV